MKLYSNTEPDVTDWLSYNPGWTASIVTAAFFGLLVGLTMWVSTQQDKGAEYVRAHSANCRAIGYQPAHYVRQLVLVGKVLVQKQVHHEANSTFECRVDGETKTFTIAEQSNGN